MLVSEVLLQQIVEIDRSCVGDCYSRNLHHHVYQDFSNLPEVGILCNSSGCRI